MGLFIVNYVFGFGAVLLFLLAFGVILGLIGIGSMVFVAYAFLNYCLQQAWILTFRLSHALSLAKVVVKSGMKAAASYFTDKILPFFRRKEQIELRLLEYAR